MSDTPLDAVIPVATLKTWLDTLDAVVDEARIHVSPEGWTAHPVDPANVAMLHTTLNSEAFEAYYAEGLTLGINIDRFREFATAGDADVVALEYDPESRKLHIESGRASFDMALIDPDRIRKDGDLSDDLEDGFHADVTLDAAALTHGIDIAGMVSDHVDIKGDPDAEDPVRISAEGDTDDVFVDYADSLHEGSTVDAEATSMFSHEYLNDLTKEIPNAEPVRVRFGDEYPLMLEYEHNDGAAEVTAMCAPRIS